MCSEYQQSKSILSLQINKLTLTCARLFLSCVCFFVTLWTAARQAALSMAILQARILEWVAMPFPRRSSQPRSPALRADSLLPEPSGKPKNSGVGSLSLLQWIFPTWEWNQGLCIAGGFCTSWATWEAQLWHGFPEFHTQKCRKELF